MKKLKTVNALVIIMFLAGCEKRGEDEKWIIPEDYSGWLIIAFNREDGTEKEYEGDARIYRFPSDGILETKFKFNDGWHQVSYFDIGKDGALKEIEYAHNRPQADEIPGGQRYVFFGFTRQDSQLPGVTLFATTVRSAGEDLNIPDATDYYLDHKPSNK